MLCQLKRVCRRCARALAQRKKLDHHADRRADFLRCLGDAVNHGLAIDCHGHIGLFRQCRQSSRLASSQDVVRNLNIAETGGGEYFCFADLLTGDAHCPRLDLSARDIGDLVGLDMRPKVNAQLITATLHDCNIVFHAIKINQDARGFQFVNSRKWHVVSRFQLAISREHNQC